ncbi:hypothetical protein HDU86_004612 [Geranomyces michiganensis]|nr:hypothetical protein HDU86_004612 [Geranomyces michiganensis]
MLAAIARNNLARQCTRSSPLTAAKQITPVASIFNFPSGGGGATGVAKDFLSFPMDQSNWAKTPTSPFAESLRAGEETRKIDMAPHPRRRFIPGELYAPADLNDKNVPRYLKRSQQQQQQQQTAASAGRTTTTDMVALDRRNPLKEYKDTVFLSSYLTQMGNMRPKSETGLSRLNQRRMTKAVKRAKAIGLIPFTYNMYAAPRK